LRDNGDLNMKKRFLASLLCVSLAFSSNIASFAEEVPQAEHDENGDEHGTSTEAIVEDDTSDNDGSNPGFQYDNNNNVSSYTDMYINIDKDADNDTVIIPDVVIAEANKYGVCHYEFNWETKRKAEISATVPLYVCMYGYGGTGNVITPGKTAYSIKNNSTYSDKQTLKNIIPYYIVIPILSQEDYVTDDTRNEYIEKLKETADYTKATDAEKNKMIENVTDEKVYNDYIDYLQSDKVLKEITLSADQKSGNYGYYTNDEGKSFNIVELSSKLECYKHDSEDSSCENIGGYYIKGTELDELKCNDITYTKGFTLTAAEEGTYLPLNIPTIRTAASWALKSEDSIGSLKAEQLFMSINGLDLSEVNNSKSFGEAHTLNIKDLNWVVPAAKKDDSGNVTKGELALPIEAAIAGGNVNDEGCVPVVRVTYLVSPAYDDSNLGTYEKIDIKIKNGKVPPSDES
jgi:hypothetical protein